MSQTKPAARPTAAKLPPHKGQELVGIALAVLAALLAAAFLTYRPSDPSVLSDPREGAAVRNLIGPVGAHIAAVGFELLGLPVLAIPLLLAAAAIRRLRQREAVRVVGRGIGAGLTIVSLPGLLQLTLSEVPWRGDPVAAGGLLGRWLASFLVGQMGFTGALLVLLGGVAVGFALLVQSSLGQILSAWITRTRGLLERLSLARARGRERRDKERARRRVEDKVLRRAREQGGAQVLVPVETLRVRERAGRPAFRLRRIEGLASGSAPVPSGEPPRAEPLAPRAAPSAPQRRPAPAEPQMDLPIEGPTEDHLPPVNLLRLDVLHTEVEENELVRLGEAIRLRCAEFGVEGTIDGISPGPVITTYEFQPAPGVKVSQIVNLQDDLALALKAESVRIERLAGRSTLGVEVPNRERALIRLGPLLAAEAFRRSPSLLTMAIGTTIYGEPYYADLATMPHLLVAGATGSGKSVGLQSMITSILYKARREEVQFIFIDPKRIELGVYADIPHLKTEVVVEPKKASNALRWAVAEMERRYRVLAEVHVRNIEHYNRAIRDPEVQRRLMLAEDEGDPPVGDLQPLPYYVVVIDELADLMMTSQAEVEASIARLAQMARAVGIHLIVATQRPSVDVLTGTIKANFPCRISFATATRHDSRTILDQVGSEKLLGRGDMLFMPPGTSRVLRLHGAYVSEQETASLIRWLKKRIGKPELDPEVLQAPDGGRGGAGGGDDEDELFEEAARMVVAEGQASASFLQRRLRVGFSRAARLVDMMERDGLLGPPQGSKPREVLVKPDFFEEWDRARRDVGA